MIVDLIKFIADSEGKILKAFMNCTQFVFSLVLSIGLYRWMMGPVEMGEITEWGIWIKWIFTGKVLVWLFIFLVSYAFLFQLVSAFITVFLVWFERKPWGRKQLPDDARVVIVRVLTFFGFLSIDKNTLKPTATRNTAKLVEYLQSADTPEVGDVMEWGYVVIQNIWVLFVLFVGYCLGTGLWRHIVLDVFLVVFLVGIPWLYRYIRWFHRMLVEHSAEFLFVIEGAYLNREIELALQGQGCPVSFRRQPGQTGGHRVFFYAGREYILVFHWVEGILDERTFDGFSNAFMKDGQYCVLFTNSGVGHGVREKVHAYADRLTVIVFEEAKHLPELLERRFPKLFPQRIVF